MISKERLLGGLNEIIYVEEGMLTTLASFSKAMVEHAEEIKDEEKKNMLKMLTRLYNDSTRHKEKVTELLKKVERSDKNEY